MRYTKSDVRGMFGRLCRAMGLRGGDYVIRNYVLDYVSVYGGYVIQEIYPESGIHHPFGAMRRSAREMYLSMLMTAQALEEIRYKQNKEV